MLTTAGAAVDTDVVNTAASGTEILWTQSAGGSSIGWVSGRTPAVGFTLTAADLSAWCLESNMNANCGGRARVYRYTPGAPATLTELGGGPFDDGVEFGTTITEMVWPQLNVTDQAFVEDERVVLKLFITNIGTMGGGFTCSVQFNAADAATGDSFFQLVENVTFKAEPAPAGWGHLLSHKRNRLVVAKEKHKRRRYWLPPLLPVFVKERLTYAPR